MWIKICGNTNFEDAHAALEAGADALGFVFAPSPRQVTEARARQIIAALPQDVETYGVFVNASFEQIVKTVESCGLTGVQLQRTEEGGLERRLYERFVGLGRKVKIIPVIGWSVRRESFGPGSDRRSNQGSDKGSGQGARQANPEEAEQDQGRFDQALTTLRHRATVDTVLVDSFSATRAGGTGTSFDWEAARSSFLQAAAYFQVVVAGGLRPENVELAISTLRPWGVDVVSGVEAYPGKKDGARLADFIRAARRAAAVVVDPRSGNRRGGQSGFMPPGDGGKKAQANILQRRGKE